MAIIIVSGLPRSGTSLMMQMLQAANIPLLSDGQRVADEDNPVGYWELELVKKIKTDSSWLNNADCHGVKIISPLMFELPDEHQYKVIVMKRAMPEVLASQRTMMARREQQGSSMPDTLLTKVFQQQELKLSRWLTTQDNCRFIEVHYGQLISEPARQVDQLIDFLQQPLNHTAMINCVDPDLYRNRQGNS
jgi:hypothetical protein